VNRYLLAAEADKIQDFIFRSSRLSEVVGGSQLLSRFCAEVPRLLLPFHGGDPDRDIVIQDGGGFRILFDEKGQAKSFGEELAEVYFWATGSSLTVAEPVEISGDFGAANEDADKSLRRAKRWRDSWQSQDQAPYIAFCASCGVGLAEAYARSYEGEKPRYLCASCLHKKGEQIEGSGSFLKAFYGEVVGGKDLSNADWPGKVRRPHRAEKDPVQDIADYDPRSYVAYLLADGNEMGKIFGECKRPDQMQCLSHGLQRIMQESLAEPAREIIRVNSLKDRSNFIPVLPLILGGDDLFALIPAPWALDFAQCFCRAYESKMAELLKEISLAGFCPTISASVVICKDKHPYTEAYRVGEAKLKEAKQLAKQHNSASESGQVYSTVNHELLKSGDLNYDRPGCSICPTLRPYWVAEQGIPEWGIPLQSVLDQRWELRSIPNKRLSELQSFYDVAELPESLTAGRFSLWKGKLIRLLNRIEHRDQTEQKSQGQSQARLLRTSLKILGQADGEETAWLYHVRRDRDPWWGHALPDLLEIWDFALKIGERRSRYEEE